MNRGVDYLGAALGEDGVPVLAFMCDCGTQTDVVLMGRADVVVEANWTGEVLEFAFTCDNCESSHWVTVEQVWAL